MVPGQLGRRRRLGGRRAKRVVGGGRASTADRRRSTPPATPGGRGVCAGAISYRMVAAVVSRTRLIRDPDALAKVDTEIAAHMIRWGSLSVDKTQREIDYWVDRYDPAAVRRTEDRVRGCHADVRQTRGRLGDRRHRGATARYRCRGPRPTTGRDGACGLRGRSAHAGSASRRRPGRLRPRRRPPGLRLRRPRL